MYKLFSKGVLFVQIKNQKCVRCKHGGWMTLSILIEPSLDYYGKYISRYAHLFTSRSLYITTNSRRKCDPVGVISIFSLYFDLDRTQVQQVPELIAIAIEVRARTIELYKPCLNVVRVGALNIPHIPPISFHRP